MTDFKHGTMSTRTQEKTFEGFIKASKFVAIAFIVVMVFLALFNS